MKEYKVGDIYGYKIHIMEKHFNPDFPGRAPRPHFYLDPVITLTGKQTFYGLAIQNVLVEGVLTTKEEVNIPVTLTWDGWVKLEEDDVDTVDYDAALALGQKRLKQRFEAEEKK